MEGFDAASGINPQRLSASSQTAAEEQTRFDGAVRKQIQLAIKQNMSLPVLPISLQRVENSPLLLFVGAPEFYR